VDDISAASASVSFRSHVLGVWIRRDRAPRRLARRLACAAAPAPLPSLYRRRLRSGSVGWRPRAR